VDVVRSNAEPRIPACTRAEHAQSRARTQHPWQELLRSLTQLASRLTQDHADAEDLVQTAIVRLLEHSDRLPHDLHARAWLYTVIRRLAIDRSRRQQRWREVEFMDHSASTDPVGPLRLIAAFGAIARDGTRDGDRQREPPFWSQLELPQIERALQHCRPEYRIVFHLYSFEGLAYQSIACQLGLPLGTVATRLRRARRQIRQKIELDMASPHANCAPVRVQAASRPR
jgi:RNA polymerase sigma-70 factor, ECF subfamily